MAEIKASLNNLRVASRKVRLVTALVKGKPVSQAKAQPTFLIKKPAPLVLKLLNSAVANAKHNFSIQENNLFIKNIVVEEGQTLKRWMPRAMGRAYPIMKRTCSVKLVLAEFVPTAKLAKKSANPQVVKEEEAIQSTAAPVAKIETKDEGKVEEAKKGHLPPKPYGASGQAKSRRFSRQTFGNIKKVFRRKSI